MTKKIKPFNTMSNNELIKYCKKHTINNYSSKTNSEIINLIHSHYSCKQLLPVIQWVGGKRRLLKHIVKYIPDNYNSYHELFFGGGSLLFELIPTKSYISDINKPLVHFYNTIKMNIVELVEEVDILQLIHNNINTKEERRENYKIMKTEFNNMKNKNIYNIKTAALFMLLNRTGFNGMYRENKKGEYNIPFGNGKDFTYDKENIHNVSNYLQKVNIFNEDFKEQIKHIENNDFVYMDPPYYNTFNSYDKSSWSIENSIEVIKLFKSLTDREISCILSNNNNEEYIKIVKDTLISGTYKIIPLSIARTLNSNSSDRKKKDCEIIIVNKYCKYN